MEKSFNILWRDSVCTTYVESLPAFHQTSFPEFVVVVVVVLYLNSLLPVMLLSIYGLLFTAHMTVAKIVLFGTPRSDYVL